MNLTIQRALPLLLSLTLWACAGPPASEPTSGLAGPGLEVRVAPLGLSGIDFACYDLRIANGDGETLIALGDPASNLLSTPPDATTLCSDRFGDGAGGAIVYVSACDARHPQHTVTLWVDGLYQQTADGLVAAPYQDPCPDGCSVTATCQANEDTPVAFNLTILRPANQGFFDVAVNFRSVHCSAKVDCLADGGGPLELLFDPASGARGQTAVLGLVCATGADGPADGEPVLLRDPIVIDCPGHDPIVLDPSAGPGNVWSASDPAPAGPIWQAATFVGASDVACSGGTCPALYWNVAVGFDPTAPGCTLTTRATAGGASLLPGFTTPEGHTWPWIDVAVDLTDANGQLACGRHPLNGVSAGVSTAYTPLDAERAFCHRFAASEGVSSSEDPACDGEVAPPPACPMTWEGDLVIDDADAIPAELPCIEEITGNLIVRDLHDDPVTLYFPLLETVGERILVHESSAAVDLSFGSSVTTDLVHVYDMASVNLDFEGDLVTRWQPNEHYSLFLEANHGSAPITVTVQGDLAISALPLRIHGNTGPIALTVMGDAHLDYVDVHANEDAAVELTFQGDFTAIWDVLFDRNTGGSAELTVAGGFDAGAGLRVSVNESFDLTVALADASAIHLGPAGSPPTSPEHQPIAIWQNDGGRTEIAFPIGWTLDTGYEVAVTDNTDHQVALPGLTELVDLLRIEDNSGTSVAATSLTALGGLSAASNQGPAGGPFDLPQLETSGSLHVAYNSGSVELSLPNLETIADAAAPSLLIVGNDFERIALPTLESAHSISIDGNYDLDDLDLSALTLVDDQFSVEDNASLSTCHILSIAITQLGLTEATPDDFPGNLDDTDDCPDLVGGPASQCPVWDGDLVIDDADEVPGDLHCVEEITGDLIVRSIADALQLAFPALEVVGGAIVFEDNWEPVTVTMAAPLVASSLRVRDSTGLDLELDDDLTLTGDLELIENGALSYPMAVRTGGALTVGGTLTVEANWDDLRLEVAGAFDAEAIHVRANHSNQVELLFEATAEVAQDVTIRDTDDSWTILRAAELTIGGALAILENTYLEVEVTVSDDASLGWLEILDNSDSREVHLTFPAGWEMATGQNVLIQGNAGLEVTLDGVEGIDDPIWFHQNSGSVLAAPDLVTLHSLSVQELDGPAEPLSFPSLQTVGSIQIGWSSGVETLAFPALEEATSTSATNLLVDSHDDLESVHLPQLRTARGVLFSYNPSLTAIGLESLESVTGQGLSLQGNDVLEDTGLTLGSSVTGTFHAKDNMSFSTCALVTIARDIFGMTWATVDDFWGNDDDTDDCPEYAGD